VAADDGVVPSPHEDGLDDPVLAHRAGEGVELVVADASRVGSRSRFHDLRHAAATFALSQGFTLEDVKNLLGHSSIVLTSNTYGHVLEQRQLAVARGMDAVLGG
jgi:integrase